MTEQEYPVSYRNVRRLTLQVEDLEKNVQGRDARIKALEGEIGWRDIKIGVLEERITELETTLVVFQRRADELQNHDVRLKEVQGVVLALLDVAGRAAQSLTQITTAVRSYKLTETSSGACTCEPAPNEPGNPACPVHGKVQRSLHCWCGPGDSSVTCPVHGNGKD